MADYDRCRLYRPGPRTFARAARENKASGSHWFDRETMEFFDARLHGPGPDRFGLFVHSTQFHASDGWTPGRRYHLAQQLSGGNVENLELGGTWVAGLDGWVHPAAHGNTWETLHHARAALDRLRERLELLHGAGAPLGARSHLPEWIRAAYRAQPAERSHCADVVFCRVPGWGADGLEGLAELVRDRVGVADGAPVDGAVRYCDVVVACDPDARRLAESLED